MQLKIGRAELTLHGEDSILQNDELRLYGVLDGLGGHGSGDVASQSSRDAIEAQFLEHTPGTVDEAVGTMKQAFRRAGQAILAAVANAEASKRMATTASVLYFFQEQDGQTIPVFGHVGDSRIYHLDGLSGYRMSQITNDESTKHGITNTIPAYSADCEQAKAVRLYPRNRFVICTDGAYGGEEWPLSKPFTEAMCTADPQEAAQALVEQKLLIDDKSVLVIDYQSALNR